MMMMMMMMMMMIIIIIIIIVIIMKLKSNKRLKSKTHKRDTTSRPTECHFSLLKNICEGKPKVVSKMRHVGMSRN